MKIFPLFGFKSQYKLFTSTFLLEAETFSLKVENYLSIYLAFLVSTYSSIPSLIIHTWKFNT